jgi:hypothetical protein
MKNQYFGDVNDYRKYGLLRTLQRIGGVRLGVCWMLTPDDGRTDGKFISYLSEPKRWRSYDPALFDFLATAVPNGRNVNNLRGKDLMPDALFFEEIIPDNRHDRALAMSVSREMLRVCDLVFFDPDNGMEVVSCQAGQKHSSKYLLWSEVVDQYNAGSSVLVYQHFRREERRTFIVATAAKFQNRTGCVSVICFRTSHVAFFLLAQARHLDALLRSAAQVSQEWKGQIEVIVDPQIVAESEAFAPLALPLGEV